MTGASDNAAGVEHVFVVEFAGTTEAVVKLLGLFCVQDCGLTHLALEPQRDGARLCVHVSDLSAQRAETVRARLAALPIVSSVALGWRPAPP